MAAPGHIRLETNHIMTNPRFTLSRRAVLASATLPCSRSLLVARTSRIRTQVRHGTRSHSPREFACQGSARSHPSGNLRPGRYQALPGQSTWQRHDLLWQVRNGSVDFFNLSSLILSTFVPALRYRRVSASPSRPTTMFGRRWMANWALYLRAEIAKTPIFTVSKIWDNGFRQVTSSGREIKSPAELKGFKVRVPAAPPLTSLFTALEACSVANQLQRGLHRFADQGGGRSRESARRSSQLPGFTKYRRIAVSPAMSGTGTGFLGTSAHSKSCRQTSNRSSTREIDKSATDQRADVAKLNTDTDLGP